MRNAFPTESVSAIFSREADQSALTQIARRDDAA
jgi:hypothetical protein